MARFFPGQRLVVPGLPIVGIEFYLHHGIVSRVDTDTGETWVIHWQRFSGQDAFVVQETTLDQFARPFPMDRVQLSPQNNDGLALYTLGERVARAKTRVGQREFDYVWNNCEHFAHWVCTGTSASKQIENTCLVAGIALCCTALAGAAVFGTHINNNNNNNNNNNKKENQRR